MDKIPVTVLIPVKNEEHNLPGCLSLLNDFGQIIVIDSDSTDNTLKIAQQFKVEYYRFHWNGQFPKKRNWALRNLSITYDWVLFLDADESLTPAFIKELQDKIISKEYFAYRVYYLNYFMGKSLKFGDRMQKLPLFKKGFGEYEKTEEDHWSHLDMEVHEHPIIQGNVGRFKNCIIHHDYKDLEHYISKHNAYSTWEAHRYVQLKKTKGANLSFRQKIKYLLIESGFLPVIYFFYSYFIKLGFLDGISGFNLARYKAHYFFQIRTKIKGLEYDNPA